MYILMAYIFYAHGALIFIRLIVVLLFFVWRIKHNKSDIIWFWTMSVVGDVWSGFSWLLNQLSKFNPIKTIPDMVALKRQYDLSDGTSKLPGIDVFVTTADPIEEPILYTMNCVLSILASDYPVDRCACYLSDDSGAMIQYEALVETAKFATLWVAFCWKHCIEPRAPESYLELEAPLYTGSAPEEFKNDHSSVHREYDEFEESLDSLSSAISKRFDAYNSMKTVVGDAKATWMANGIQWPGSWIDTMEIHRKGHHAGIVKIYKFILLLTPILVVLDHSIRGHNLGSQASTHNLNFANTNVRLPMLVYISRGKNPSYDHNKKFGALNAQLRAFALLSNAQSIINFDCDHYINNSQALHTAMCFMLDQRQGDNTALTHQTDMATTTVSSLMAQCSPSMASKGHLTLALATCSAA